MEIECIKFIGRVRCGWREVWIFAVRVKESEEFTYLITDESGKVKCVCETYNEAVEKAKELATEGNTELLKRAWTLILHE